MTNEMLEKSLAYATRNLMDEHAPHLKQDKLFLRQNFDLNQKKVLDFGCGMGGMSLWYAQNWSCQVHAIDIDAHHIQIAEALKAKFPTDRVQFEKRNILEAPLDQMYDAIFLNDVAEHIAYPVLEQLLQQFSRVMNPDASLFISYPPWEGPYASHVQSVTGLLWSQYLPKPLLMALIKRRNKAITGEIEGNFLEVYKGLNRLNHARLINLTSRAGLVMHKRLSHSILKRSRYLKSLPVTGFPFRYLVSKELLIFKIT